jgi:uncharacterized protein (TIGR02996 family)
MSAPLSDEDKAFVRAILNSPADLTGWLSYADWLDERDDPRAEFIRLEVRRGQLRRRDPEWGEVEPRLQELRTSLDPDWVAIFDRPKIENCDEAFRFKCPKKWEQLTGTDYPAVRHCETCDKKVYYCATLRDAQNHAYQGDCVAVQLGVLRYPSDLVLREDEQYLDDAMVMGELRGDYEPEPRRPWWKFW